MRLPSCNWPEVSLFLHRVLVTAILASTALVEAAQAAPQSLPPCGPYLQDAYLGSVTIVWRPGLPVRSTLVVRDDLGKQVFMGEAPPTAQPQIEVKGLTPGQYYNYELSAPGNPLQKGHFIASRAANASHLRFAVVGDMGDGSPAQFAIAKQMINWKPELLLTVGDNVYPDGSAADFGPKFFDPYGPLLANAPCFPALGNHDIHTDNGAPYLQAFVLPQAPSGGRYYAFDDGPVRFWALDSNQSLAPGSAQYEWLAADAAASPARWKVAFFHHPPFSSGLHGQEAKNRGWLPALFSRLGFSLVMNGHDHHYERSKPINGVTYIVTGGGGAFLYGTTEQPFTAYKAVRHEFLAVSIYRDRMGIEAIDEDGKTLDAATIERPIDPRER
jgi:hypothetical protein